MYLPKHFSADWKKVRQLIEAYGFATVLSFPKDQRPFINHLPLILESKDEREPTLIGHMARRNPQWLHFQQNPSCTVIVNGPHTYITPRWYQSGRDVPTWNYAVAHLHGKIELVENFKEQVDVLKKLSEYFEEASSHPWEFELPDDLSSPATLTSAIVSFRFKIEEIEAKFKLSQNRPDVDRAGVISGLQERTDDMSRSILEMMLKTKDEIALKP